MDARTTYLEQPDSRQNSLIADRPPVLLSGAGHLMATARSGLEATGLRTTIVPLADLGDRIALQPRASAVWVELDEELTTPFDAALARAAEARDFPLIISLGRDRIDELCAAVEGTGTDLLIEPTALDRATAIALAMAGRDGPAVLNDVTAEPSAARLRQLSDEVGRIAATLARLSSGPGTAAIERPSPSPSTEGSAPSVPGEVVRQVIRARRLRARYFDAELFADPAWDMLLDLLHAEIMQHRVPVSSLCIAASVPPTTALRWIKTMTDSGLFHRRADPHDGRRIFIELAPQASEAMRRYFEEIGRVPII